jgi:hypothetical protein
MIQKTKIVYLVFFIALCYIVSPWFFEKRLFFNELLSISGLFIFLYKKLPLVKTQVYIYLFLLIILGICHCIISLFRMDGFYYYLRNSVIVYSMFTFFIGFFTLKYLGPFIKKIRQFLYYYISIFLLFPISKFLFERYGMATLFPALLKKNIGKWGLPLLILINVVYAITYKSSTSFVLSLFYFVLLLIPGYKFFKQLSLLAIIIFFIFLISILPDLNLIRNNFSVYNEEAIRAVMSSNTILGLDPNNTWRLVLWKQFIFDLFPANIFGIGLGTPAIKYYPVADFSKLESLPYVLGAHNSFIYLFSRLGIIYLLLMVLTYLSIFKEYFYYKQYYKNNNEIFIFYSFFAITIISAFNPTLETPIFAAGYWLILGFTVKSIYNRQVLSRSM